MNVDLMRKIDFYAGVPLCFLVSNVLKLFKKNRWHKAKCKNILFVELSEMGSAILSDPAMRKAKKNNNSELFFVIFKKNVPSLELLQTVKKENIFVIREDSIINLIFDTLRFFIWTRKTNIDTIIDLELFSRFTSLLTALSGASNRVGFFGYHNEGLYRGDMLTHKVSYNTHIHIAKNFIALVNSLEKVELEIPFSKTLITDDEIKIKKITFPDGEKERIKGVVKKLYPNYSDKENKIVLINPNSSELLVQRRWMPKYYVMLIKTILDNHKEVLILLTGAANERKDSNFLVEDVKNDRCVNFAGKTKLIELPILYSFSHIMISNDSGPPHFASTTDIPTFVFFGPETPKLYGSLGNFTPLFANLACSPCVTAANHRKTPCINNVCLSVIKPEYVYSVVKPHIENQKSF